MLGVLVEFDDTKWRFKSQSFDLVEEVVSLYGIAKDCADGDALFFQLTTDFNDFTQELTGSIDSEERAECGAELSRDMHTVGQRCVETDRVGLNPFQFGSGLPLCLCCLCHASVICFSIGEKILQGSLLLRQFRTSIYKSCLPRLPT